MISSFFLTFQLIILNHKNLENLCIFLFVIFGLFCMSRVNPAGIGEATDDTANDDSLLDHHDLAAAGALNSLEEEGDTDLGFLQALVRGDSTSLSRKLGVFWRPLILPTILTWRQMQKELQIQMGIMLTRNRAQMTRTTKRIYMDPPTATTVIKCLPAQVLVEGLPAVQVTVQVTMEEYSPTMTIAVLRKTLIQELPQWCGTIPIARKNYAALLAWWLFTTNQLRSSHSLKNSYRELPMSSPITQCDHPLPCPIIPLHPRQCFLFPFLPRLLLRAAPFLRPLYQIFSVYPLSHPLSKLC